MQAYLLEHLKAISIQQWGYLKGMSTTRALLTAIEEWHHALEMGGDKSYYILYTSNINRYTELLCSFLLLD